MEDKALKVIDKRMSAVEGEATDSGEPNAVILKAMDKNYSPELIEKMMDLQERYEKGLSQKAYVQAMASFKKNPPEILKTKHVEYVNSKNKTVEWDHAQLGEIAEAINKGLSEWDLYSRWDMEQPDKATVKTTCIITHADGHSEQISMSGPPDTSGNKDELKAVASTNTILQRLTLLALTGLAAKGTDIEHPSPKDVEDDFISEEQLKELVKEKEAVGMTDKLFLRSLKVETLSVLPANKFKFAMGILKARKGQ